MQCQNLPGALGIGGGRYLYCASITENRPYVKIMVGETEAQIFDFNDNKQVWYAVANSNDMNVWGSYATGEPMKIR
jgi:hypothetical protein